MSYIYTVKPIKEATQIAIKLGHFDVEENGNISIYGIFRENWPAGVSVKSTKRITDSDIYNVGKIHFTIPVSYFTETEEADEADEANEVPEFITGLYDAMTASCGNNRSEKCPLNIVGDCTIFTNFIRDKWDIEK